MAFAYGQDGFTFQPGPGTGSTRTGRNSAAPCAGKTSRSWTGSSTGPGSTCQAGSYASRPWPLETILVSILLEQEKELAELRAKLEVVRKEGLVPG